MVNDLLLDSLINGQKIYRNMNIQYYIHYFAIVHLDNDWRDPALSENLLSSRLSLLDKSISVCHEYFNKEKSIKNIIICMQITANFRLPIFFKINILKMLYTTIFKITIYVISSQRIYL